MAADNLSFLYGGNTLFIAELYARYVANPASVDSSWADFFADLNDEAQEVLREVKGASWTPPPIPETLPSKADKGKKDAKPGIDVQSARAATLDSIRALMMIRTYRVRGHLMANLDPLKMAPPNPHPELDYHSYGFTEADLDRPIFIDNVLGLETAPLRQILAVLRETYCGSIGVEFMHIQDPDQKAWIQKRIESIRNQTEFTPKGKKTILQRLTEAEGFEKFLQVKYTGTKRFGLEGGEAMIPAVEQIAKQASQMGVEEIIIGMPHRGRLNMLANIMHKPYRAIFSEFQGNPANPSDFQGSGDVKYHLGTSADREFDDKKIHLSLQANPSHLEAVDPVVLGRVRAKQTQLGDTERSKVMGLLLHGDAAFAGQGMVAECFTLSQLESYGTGGTVHLVVNNQIGFTTAPRYSRSGPYCTDVAKMVQAPIFHVNGDDIEAVVHVSRIATEFRQIFKTDVVIDMVCYRRHGHNEADEPAFTQPIMYKKISGQPTTREVYSRKLIAEGALNEEESKKIYDSFNTRLEAEYQAGQSYKVNKADWLEGKWAGFSQAKGEEEQREEPTSISTDLLKEVGYAIFQIPANVKVNPKIIRQLEAKRKMIDSGQGIDWSTAEALAFGTLLVEGVPVRLSGQDCGRGTFSQRHSVLVDQETEERFVPLRNIRPNQANFQVIDSLLSEEAVMGYEYGYSLAEPNALVMWEGQFGDFANGAQVIMDQFISSGESKWLRMSGLVLLLPHGFEGQGPEHSSARWERYLQLCAEDNMQVVNCTTPANYFHVLRRQVCRNFRKPLIVMTPKSLLRHKLCVSPTSDLMGAERFHRVLPEGVLTSPDSKIKRVVLCSGKVYFDLLEERTKRGTDDVALIRVEQLYPWPKDTLVRELSRYKDAEVIWCQEEPANMGPWMFVDRRIEFVLEEVGGKSARASYVGRKASASPATGLHKTHVIEQNLLVDQALSWETGKLPQPFRRMGGLKAID